MLKRIIKVIPLKPTKNHYTAHTSSWAIKFMPMFSKIAKQIAIQEGSQHSMISYQPDR